MYLCTNYKENRNPCEDSDDIAGNSRIIPIEKGPSTMFTAIGFAIALLGLVFSLFSIIWRSIRYKDGKVAPNDRFYWLWLMGLATVGCILGTIGFFLIVQTSIDSSGVDYSQILTVLSLLAAAVVVGWFTFTYAQALEDEAQITTAISCCFFILFYIIFAAISFYMGRSSHVHKAPYTTCIVPIIMGLLLLTNTLFDFWDYRKSSYSSNKGPNHLT